MDNFKVFIMENITNMHVGDGDINFNIIDNQVQRDVLTGFPTINPSSLKGSLRSFLNNKIKDYEKIKDIFGNEEKGIGKYKFFGASLLSIPVRSNIKPFFRATCPLIIREFLSYMDSFNVNIELQGNIKGDGLEKLLNKVNKEKGVWLTETGVDNIKAEGYSIKAIEEYNKFSTTIINLQKVFGEDLVIFDDNIFKYIVKELPVIARNKLENGESKNLWYEEVVPRKSKFYFGIIEDEIGIIEDENGKDFNQLITSNIVQFGGNATIGYGYCNIKDLEDVLKDQQEGVKNE